MVNQNPPALGIPNDSGRSENALADFIRASGRIRRAKRSDTWPHPVRSTSLKLCARRTRAVYTWQYRSDRP